MHQFSFNILTFSMLMSTLSFYGVVYAQDDHSRLTAQQSQSTQNQAEQNNLEKNKSGSSQIMILPTIVVQALKRPEIQQHTPMSVEIFSVEQQLALEPYNAITAKTVNLNIIDQARAGDRYGTMRGIGSLGMPLNSLDNTIGYAVDGIATSQIGFAAPLMDVKQIEVLRGPQGTLFGRNALGGMINVVNHEADGERTGHVTGEWGSDGYWLSEFAAGDWLIPNQLAIRAVARYQDYDGDIENVTIGGKEGDANLKAGRISLGYIPDDSLNIDLTASISRDHRSNVVWISKEHPKFPVSSSDVHPIGNRDIAQLDLKIVKQLDLFDLSSISSIQDIKLKSYDDYSEAFAFGKLLGMDASLFNDPNADKGTVKDKERIISQEFRLNSKADATTSWVVGMNYFRSDYRTLRDLQSSIYPTVNGLTDNQIDSETYAVFFDISLPLTEKFKLSGGLRVAHDRQTLDGKYRSNGNLGQPVFSLTQNNQVEDDYVTGRLALSHQTTDHSLNYLSIARGYSSGGFERSTNNAALNIKNDPFKPSTVWTYELGNKSQIVDFIQLNSSVFFNDVKDGQLSGFDTQTYQVFFANQDYQSYGAEFGLNLQPLDTLNLYTNVGYVKSKLVNTQANIGNSVKDGNQIPNSSEWTVNAGFDYQQPLSFADHAGQFNINLNYQYTGSRQTDIQNNIKLEPYHMLNSRIGFEYQNTEFYGFIQNILDERPIFYASSYGVDNTTVIVGRGRVVGLGVKYQW